MIHGRFYCSIVVISFPCENLLNSDHIAYLHQRRQRSFISSLYYIAYTQFMLHQITCFRILFLLLVHAYPSLSLRRYMLCFIASPLIPFSDFAHTAVVFTYLVDHLHNWCFSNFGLLSQGLSNEFLGRFHIFHQVLHLLL